MHIELSTDSHIQGRESLQTRVEATVEAALGRYRQRITRVEVHLRDENGPKAGADDIRCAMEVRLEGLKPAGVTHNASEIEDAVSGAAHKLQRVIEHALGRIEANN